MSASNKPKTDSIKPNSEVKKLNSISSTIETKYNLIYSHSHLGIVFFNNDGIIADCNDKFSEIVGFSNERLIGQNILKLFEENSIFLSILKSFNKLSPSFDGEYLNVSKNIRLFIRGHFINNTSQGSEGSLSAGIFEDVTSSQKIEYKFELLAQLFKNLSECVIITNTDNRINYVNDAFINLYGYSEVDILGKEIQILLSNSNSKEINNSVHKPNNESEPWRGVLLNVKKDGTEFPIYLSSTLLNDSFGNGYSRIGIIRDITNEKQIEKELISAKIKAEQSDKLKSEFLGQMSHEIRTPINIILNISNMILEDNYFDADEDTQSTFAILDSAGKRIVRTIDLILNMSDVQVGAYSPSLKKFDLFAEMYNSFYKEFSKRADEKDLDFTWENKTNSAFVTGDIYSISQMFANLLHNAMQYTHIGGIKIIFRENESENLVVDFVDSGIGISQEFLPNIFNTFSQEVSGYTRKYEGNGLGLSLTKAYSQINKVKIDIKSEKGFGSTFSLTFTR